MLLSPSVFFPSGSQFIPGNSFLVRLGHLAIPRKGNKMALGRDPFSLLFANTSPSYDGHGAH